MAFTKIYYEILIQKIFRLVDELDLDTHGTIRDRINRAEKKELIENGYVFVEIRMVRNDIAHEYLPEAIRDKIMIPLTWKILKACFKVSQCCPYMILACVA